MWAEFPQAFKQSSKAIHQHANPKCIGATACNKSFGNLILAILLLWIWAEE